jgi:hypothetical protein
MHGDERWLKLCAEAAAEQNPERLMHLTKEVLRLLDEREAQMKANRERNDVTDGPKQRFSSST